ncbi:MAG: hypothetical protein C4B58_08045 [Deltaproteobacteria bacterium]|nr:MAG: hypothetical protein C4B58_08045 [Deltaproteobacteria bacterium]
MGGIEKGDIMDAIECIKKRMSIRAFKPEKVPKDLLMEVVNIAKWSPSYNLCLPLVKRISYNIKDLYEANVKLRRRKFYLNIIK